MKYRIVAHYPYNDTYWYGKVVEMTEEQHEQTQDFISEVCKRGEYLSLEAKDGSVMFFPEKMIQQLVITLEKSNEI